MVKWTINDLKGKGIARVNGVYKKIGAPIIKKLNQEKIEKVLEKLAEKGLKNLK